MTKTVFYISFSKLEYSVNAVYIMGLEQNNVPVCKVHVNKRRFVDYFRALGEYWSNRKNIGFIIIGYDSPQLATLMRPFSRKKIVYNALCSVYERYVVSRAIVPRISIKSFYYWLIDFLGAHASDLVMLETNEQIKYFSRLFGVSEKKCFRAWTGVDESRFFYNPNILRPEIFTVIFRGGLLPESGAEYAVRAAKILEKEKGLQFIMHANDQELPKIQRLVQELRPANLRLITSFLSDEDLRTLMQKSHLSLGQLSSHPRLTRTIPHKAYESLVLRLPYLTANNRGIMELLEPGETCIVCNPADPESLAKQIMWAKNHPQELEKIAENGYRLYKEKLTSKILAGQLLQEVEKLFAR